MYTPRDISKTENVYWSLLAGFYLVDKFNQSVKEACKIKTIVIPGFGTGCGKMDFYEASKQMIKAFESFLNGQNNKDQCPQNNLYLHKPKNKLDFI